MHCNRRNGKEKYVCFLLTSRWFFGIAGPWYVGAKAVEGLADQQQHCESGLGSYEKPIRAKIGQHHFGCTQQGVMIADRWGMSSNNVVKRLFKTWMIVAYECSKMKLHTDGEK